MYAFIIIMFRVVLFTSFPLFTILLSIIITIVFVNNKLSIYRLGIIVKVRQLHIYIYILIYWLGTNETAYHHAMGTNVVLSNVFCVLGTSGVGRWALPRYGGSWGAAH